MLPAMAASTSINNGRPSAAATMYSSLSASAKRPGPSVRICHELAIRLRSGFSMLPPIEPEKDDSTSVAPAITNQVLTSWLLATSPRSRASSRRFCVGSSVFSVSSLSSAIVSAPSVQRHQVVHDADEVIHVGPHHGHKHRGEDHEAREDRERHADEVDLHLRHQPRQHAKSDIEDETE